MDVRPLRDFGFKAACQICFAACSSSFSMDKSRPVATEALQGSAPHKAELCTLRRSFPVAARDFSSRLRNR